MKIEDQFNRKMKTNKQKMQVKDLLKLIQSALDFSTCSHPDPHHLLVTYHPHDKYYHRPTPHLLILGRYHCLTRRRTSGRT